MVERIKAGMVNAYLIQGEKRSVLVDTGTGKEKEAIFEQIRHKNVGLIVLTHGHLDHIGGTAFLAQRLCVPVAMHKADYSLLTDTALRQLFADSVMGNIMKSTSEILSRSAKTPGFEPDFFLEDGQSLEEYGVSARVLALPGHTQGSIGLLSKKELIAGDAMVNYLKPSAALLYEDKAEAERSLARIKKSGAQTIHPGHGKSFLAKDFFSHKK